MTASLLDRQAVDPDGPQCPPWCSNWRHLAATGEDACGSVAGDRDHVGRIGGVVLPSRVDEYYDEEIGVELFRYEYADGSLGQLSVLLTYGAEHQETGHVCLDIDEARRLVAFARSDSGSNRRQQARFGVADENNILMEQPCGHLSARVDMDVEGSRHRLELHRAQLDCLADIVASACLLSGVAR